MKPLPSFMAPPARGLLTPDNLHDYQRFAINHQCSKPHTNLWLDMGLGKTIITLTSIAHLQARGWLGPVLVVAPLTVVETVWQQQAQEWEHTRHLRFSRITGDQNRRTTQLLKTQADIYLINYENLMWLKNTLQHYFMRRGKAPPFNGVVWDEISKMKNSVAKRVNSVLAWLPYTKWRTGLTGTPSGNGYEDLHGQYLVLDQGARLGTSLPAYRNRWFRSAGDYRRVLQPGADQQIHALIQDITIEMSEEQYLQLPPMVVNDIWIDLPGGLRTQYQKLEDDMYFELENGLAVEVFNAAAKTNKCLQFSNGAVYLEPGEPEFEVVHDYKLEALDRILDESPGQPVLVGYAYTSDAERIMERYKSLRPVNLTKSKDKAADIQRWIKGDIRLMVGHPASMGHGVDGLQKRGNIAVWFGPNWSLELYKQFNARLRRQGQGRPVVCHRILTRDTLDEAVIDALASKDTTERGLRSAIRKYRTGR